MLDSSDLFFQTTFFLLVALDLMEFIEFQFISGFSLRVIGVIGPIWLVFSVFLANELTNFVHGGFTLSFVFAEILHLISRKC
mgnify:CR=1 FL=1